MQHIIPLTPEEEIELASLFVSEYRIPKQRKRYYDCELPFEAERISELVYRQFSRMMYNDALKYTGSREDAQDMVHDAIVVFQRRGSWQAFNPNHGSSYSAWFYRVYQNAFKELYKQRLRDQNNDVDSLDREIA